jgi:hypothetical protein
MTKNIKISLNFVGVIGFYVVAALAMETTQSNPYGWILLLIGIGYSIAGTFRLAIAEFRERLVIEATDIAYWWPGAGMLAVCLSSPLEYIYLSASLPRGPAIQEAGILLFGIGLITFLWAGWISNRNGGAGARHESRGLTTRPDVYQLVRYPAGAGLGMIAFSICLGYSSLYGLLAFLLIFVPGVLYRLRSGNRVKFDIFFQMNWR